MKAGSAVFIPGKTLHGGGNNTDGIKRRAIVASYVLGGVGNLPLLTPELIVNHPLLN